MTTNVLASDGESVRETAAVALLALLVPVLLFHNLSVNPAPWHDEGGVLQLAKTLGERGVYGSAHSEGYQTFGAVQSVGPTIVAPIAVAYRYFSDGVMPGRVVAACYAMLAVSAFYWLGRRLFGWRTAFVAVLLLLGWGGEHFSGFLLLGRQALGEVPALAWFLASILCWQAAFSHGGTRAAIMAGVCAGAAMVTKSQYLIIVLLALCILAVLDRVYYRLGVVKDVMIGGSVAAVLFGLWQLWQLVYFGSETFFTNARNLKALGAATTGFDYHLSIDALQFLFGTGSGHMYLFWGLPALVYVAIGALQRTPTGMTVAFVSVFATLWLGTFVFVLTPWPHYALPPVALAALFVAKLWHDATHGFQPVMSCVVSEVRAGRPGKASLELTVLAVCVLIVGYQLQRTVRTDVLARHDAHTEVAHFMEKHIRPDAIIETWERELAVLTRLSFHFPDQSLLGDAHAAAYRHGKTGYALGNDYFAKHKADYVVIGWYARTTGIYDVDYVASHGCRVVTLGEYDVYRLKRSDNMPCD